MNGQVSSFDAAKDTSINLSDLFLCHDVYWSQTVFGSHEKILPEGEDNHPGEECDPCEEAHQRQNGHILAVRELELCCAEQDSEHDQDLR